MVPPLLDSSSVSERVPAEDMPCERVCKIKIIIIVLYLLKSTTDEFVDEVFRLLFRGTFH